MWVHSQGKILWFMVYTISMNSSYVVEDGICSPFTDLCWSEKEYTMLRGEEPWIYAKREGSHSLDMDVTWNIVTRVEIGFSPNPEVSCHCWAIVLQVAVSSPKSSTYRKGSGCSWHHWLNVATMSPSFPADPPIQLSSRGIALWPYSGNHCQMSQEVRGEGYF